MNPIDDYEVEDDYVGEPFLLELPDEILEMLREMLERRKELRPIGVELAIWQFYQEFPDLTW